MNWEVIWNKKKKYNGYKFKNLEEYNKFIIEITKNIKIKDGSTILDIGCGDGYAINYFLQSRNLKNCIVYGIDFSDDCIKHAINTYKGNYIIHNIKEEFPFKDNMFDNIFCLSVLFYLSNKNEIDKVISEINRTIKSNASIFLGNCLDYNSKEKNIIMRKNVCNKKSSHLYITKQYILDKYHGSDIKIIDNSDLDLDFYTFGKFKFNAYINYKNKKINKKINIGVDFHDTISYNPDFFKILLKKFTGKRYIITGTPLSKKSIIISQLELLGFFKNVHYDEIGCGYEYEKDKMNYNHFDRMKKHKLLLLNKFNIKVYFDDNPYYVDFLKDKGIFVYQTILSKNYINHFSKKDKYFCSNLQATQFNFIKDFQDKNNIKIYIPGVFDLFHVGHLKLIKKIKNKYNGMIIIGLQQDESVFQQKNKYPIFSLTERKNMILNLDIVDNIIPYSDLNQIIILKQLKINYFVIGPEYGTCIEHINTLKYCKKNNIKIIRTIREPGISTTEIISRIRQNINN